MLTDESTLSRHVPELALDWAAQAPERRWQSIDGTLCFADISGFTALAERLAQRGRMGGEELVETLGRVFRTMIGIARGRGGMLLKFGGDALLLFFPGPNHAMQAASAAVEMRAALREAAKIPTSVGPLKLSMSVGLHSGDALFFLVGSTHRELVLLGPAANAVVAVEGAANAGEILVSEGTAARLPATAVKPRDDGERLLRWRKGAIEPEPRARDSVQDEALAAGLFPKQLGQFLAPGAPDPEHRVACISFIRFSGTDRLLEEEGADALADALDTTIGRVQEVLVAEGVTLLAVDLDNDGGKLFMASGVPYAHEDDEGVMMRALRRVADMDLPLPLQIGVNRGHVFAAEVGDAQRAAFSSMGDTTNTAARITAKTPAGKIFAHPAVLDECLTLYEVTPAEPLTMKGKAAPLVVYEVGAALGPREREGLELDVVVGRAEELSVLREAARKLGEGKGGVVTLEGETGLGKTRLLREASEGIATRVAFRAEPYGVNSAYRMLRDPVRELLGIERGDAERMRARLEQAVADAAPGLVPMLALIGDVVGVPVEPSEAVQAIEARFRPDRTADVVVELLGALVAGPVAFVVDESHWCDDASAHLLTRLEVDCDERPWLLLVARRAADQGYRPEAGQVLAIEPMPDADMRSFVQELTEAAPLRTHELDIIVKRAGGFPLFAGEIIRALREVGSLEAVPESLEAAMATQVDALDRSPRRILQYASVLGRSFSKDMLATLLESEGGELDQAQLDRLGEFLIPEGRDRLQFRSGMLRDTVYEGVAYRLRTRLHRAAGEATEARADDLAEVADALAVHYARAGDAERTWRFGCLAGDRAKDRFANADAARFYELALDAQRRLKEVPAEQVGEIWLRLGLVGQDAGFYQEALDAYRRAGKLAGSDPLGRAESLFRQAHVRDVMGNASVALRNLSQSDRLIENETSMEAASLRAGVASWRANVLFHAQRPSAAVEQATQAIDLCRGDATREALAQALAIRDMARAHLEGVHEGAGLQRALEIYEELGSLVAQGTVLINLGVFAAIDGRWTDAEGFFEAARERYLRGGNSVEAAFASRNLGELWLCQGHLNEASDVLEDALRIARAGRWTEGACALQLQIGHLLIERGEFAEADRLLQQTAETSLDMGQRGRAVDATLMRAAGNIVAGDLGGGRRFLGEAMDLGGGELGMLMSKALLLEALLLARENDPEGAMSVCERGLEAAQGYGQRFEASLLARLFLTVNERTEMASGDIEKIVEAAALVDALGVVTTPRAYSLPTGSC